LDVAKHHTKPVPEGDVRAQLEAILISEAFRRAEGQGRLLRYLVEQSLAGDQGAFKEYTIGVKVFGRSESFDPQVDGVVRLETMRLRARLKRYYAAEGQAARLLIVLPKGSYVPVFQPRFDRRVLPKRWMLRSAIVLAVTLVATASYFLFRHVRASNTTHDPSVAVLPFWNLTGDPENDYFSDGLAADLTVGLAKLPGLRVVARTSAFLLRGQTLDAREMGRRLSVGALIEGSLRKEGDLWRIAVELINTVDGYHLWAQTYRVTRKDLPLMQDEILREVAPLLHVSAGGAGSESYVPDEAARELFWRGRYLRRKDIRRQPEVGYFEQAVALDPKYAEAWGWLAYMYATMAHHRQGGPMAVMAAKAKAAAEQAIALDSANAMAHASLGAVLYSCDWNWPQAEREFRRALELNPRDAASHNAYSIGLMLHGRFPEALEEIQQAMTIDPLGYRVMDDRGEILFMARRYPEAIREAETVLQADPAYGPTRLVLGISLAASGRYDDAIATLAVLVQSERVPEYLGRYAAVLASAGRRAQAEGVLKELLAMTASEKSSRVYVAYVYAALGEPQKAFEELATAVANRDADVLRLPIDPAFDGLRSDPRYAALRRSLGE